MRKVLSMMLPIALLVLLFGCATKREQRAYERGLEEGFEEGVKTMQDADHITEMRKEMRGESPKRFTP